MSRADARWGSGSIAPEPTDTDTGPFKSHLMSYFSREADSGSPATRQWVLGALIVGAVSLSTSLVAFLVQFAM